MSIVRKAKRRIWPQVKFKVDPNSTHHDFLKASLDFLISKTPDNVEIFMVEVGTGGTSSRVMRSYLERYSQMRLISFENDFKWFQTYKINYSTNDRHALVFVENDSWDTTIKESLNKVSKNASVFSFIDSSPWESRIQALDVLRNRSDIFLIHDVDFFPHNNLFGKEIKPIKYAPANPFFYGKLKSKNLGLRDYEEIAQYWVEAFPRIPGYFTGPPTLIASEFYDIRSIQFPDGSIQQSKSDQI